MAKEEKLPPIGKGRLSWQNDEMVWHDKDSKVVRHPRYWNKPASLHSKIFVNAYIRFSHEGKSLNDFMKEHGNYTSAEVQKAAKDLKRQYEELTSDAGKKDTIKLLRAKKKPKNTGGILVARALVACGARSQYDPKIKQLWEEKE